MGINEQIKVSVIDTFNDAFYKAYNILELNIPLKVAEREEVESFENALQLKRCVEGVAEQIKIDNNSDDDVDEDGNDDTSIADYIITTAFSPCLCY